jgi:hypothetical protein
MLAKLLGLFSRAAPPAPPEGWVDPFEGRNPSRILGRHHLYHDSGLDPIVDYKGWPTRFSLKQELLARDRAAEAKGAL